MAGAGMAWGRRRRWRSATAEALGLPLLALAAGAFCWLLDPLVRGDLAVGQPIAALSLHGAGWLGAVAFWRGEVHRSTEDDDVIQDRLLRWVLPGLAIPWLVGHATSTRRHRGGVHLGRLRGDRLLHRLRLHGHGPVPAGGGARGDRQRLAVESVMGGAGGRASRSR